MKPSRACPECGETVPAEPIDRRQVLKLMGAGAAALAIGTPAVARAAEPDRTAEELIKELYTSLDGDAKKAVISPFEHEGRLKFYNRAIGKPIGEAYTKPQQEVVEKILRAICSGDEGWNQVSRGGTWNNSKAFVNCGANLFGDPEGKYTWVFTGHHLTIRCDGDSVEGPALGGPLYYGHSPNGYSTRNLFNYQTKSALAVFESLSKEQRGEAMVKGTPGEQLPSVRFRADESAMPGIAISKLDEEQRGLVEKVMRDVLSPYRKADGDEVMRVIKGNGGMEKVHFAFYHDGDEIDAKQPWTFWRLEGPGFVWNFRVLPHVHTFVNISSKV